MLKLISEPHIAGAASPVTMHTPAASTYSQVGYAVTPYTKVRVCIVRDHGREVN